MKKIFLLFVFCSSAVFAQNTNYKHSLQGVKKVRIESSANVKVITGNTSELILGYDTSKAKSGNNRNTSLTFNSIILNNKSKILNNKSNENRKKGLRPVYPGGKDNTEGLGFSIEKKEGILIVKDLKSRYQSKNILITLPKSMNISVDGGIMGAIFIDGFTSEVEADSNVGTINLNNVTGPVTAHSSVGTINVVFSKINQSSPISITSATGEIDVAISENAKVDLDIRAGGTLYTNFNFKASPKKGMENVSGLRNIVNSLNGGGVKMKLKSTMGNIYLRKKE